MSQRPPNDLAADDSVKSSAGDVAPAESVPAVGDDPREYPRFSFRGRAQAVILPPPSKAGAEPQEWEVLTTDVSRSGLSLLHRKPLEPGQQVLLVLNDATRTLEVCWCCRVWTGLYVAGCRFVNASATAS